MMLIADWLLLPGKVADLLTVHPQRWKTVSSFKGNIFTSYTQFMFSLSEPGLQLYHGPCNLLANSDPAASLLSAT